MTQFQSLTASEIHVVRVRRLAWHEEWRCYRTSATLQIIHVEVLWVLMPCSVVVTAQKTSTW